MDAREWSDRVTDWDILDSHRELHQEDVWRGGDGGIERKIIRQWDYTAQIAWKLLVSQQRFFAGILLTDKEMTLFDNDTYAVASLDPIDENATWDKYVVTYTSAVSTLVMKEEYFYDTGRYQSWEKDRFSQFTWDERLTKRVTSDAEDYYERQRMTAVKSSFTNGSGRDNRSLGSNVSRQKTMASKPAGLRSSHRKLTRRLNCGTSRITRVGTTRS